MSGRAYATLAAVLLVLLAGLIISFTHGTALAQESQPDGRSEMVFLVTGTIVDRQNLPVKNALVTLIDGATNETLAEGITQPDGRYAMNLDRPVPDQIIMHIERPHFHETDIELGKEAIQTLHLGQPVGVPEVVLARKVTPAFWIATLVFVGVLVLIATGTLHNTLAALLGMAVVLGVSYLGEPINNGLFIFYFQGALAYVDWNVIFLIMGMMMVIAVVERTGIFQWMAFMAYRTSGGRTWLLVIILMLITGIASAFLDNVTTMLLMTPISVQIALALGIMPLALIIPEVFASNVVGISTLIGTPTNILIGSYAHITFTDFLINLTPGVLMALLGLIIYSLLVYREDLSTDGGHGTSDVLLDKLAERAQITEPEHLRKAAWVGAGMLFLFVFGEHIHLIPAVTAIIGATALLIWIRPNIDEMIEAVDWTTLVFFIALFIIVGAVQEVGLISFIAELIGQAVGDNLLLAMLAVIWLSALLSTVIANIPFTAAMLPVVAFLTATIPGASNKALFFCLSVGSAMGGNGSLIGASANMVTAGIADRAGFPITYAYFFRKGFPALLITVGLATIWLLIRFLLLPS
ncbi:MAG: SLC13 family permease [Candidatus Promineifilaceae bacterium]|jgi:Na+/H+ antiporter NhaD/arsenite permease-like protein